jgi:hypothetical protein
MQHVLRVIHLLGDQLAQTSIQIVDLGVHKNNSLGNNFSCENYTLSVTIKLNERN